MTSFIFDACPIQLAGQSEFDPEMLSYSTIANLLIASQNGICSGGLTARPALGASRDALQGQRLRGLWLLGVGRPP